MRQMVGNLLQQGLTRGANDAASRPVVVIQKPTQRTGGFYLRLLRQGGVLELRETDLTEH